MNTETEQIFICVTPSDNISADVSQKFIETPALGPTNLENVEDFSNVCRTCANVTEFLIPIFEGEGLQSNLAEKVNKYLPIQVSPLDTLPVAMCYQCAHALLAWHEVAAAAPRADHALREAQWRFEQKIREQNPASIEENQSLENTNDKESGTVLIVRILNDYLSALGIDGESSDLQFVCQKCPEQPAAATAGAMAGHLTSTHEADLMSGSLKQFVEDNITVEEQLVLEDVDEVSIAKEVKEELPHLSCPFCSSVFSSPTRLLSHLSRHVDVCVASGVTCCDQEYHSKAAFAWHLQEMHVEGGEAGGGVKCRACGHTAVDENELKEHIGAAHPEPGGNRGKTKLGPNNIKRKPVACPVCEKTFSNVYHATEHLATHDAAAAPRRFPCDRCGKVYQWQKSLAKHVRQAHEGRLRFHCGACGEAFPDRAARAAHARRHAAEPAPGTHRCRYCDKALHSGQALAAHLHMHLDVRNYSCEVCPKRFRKLSHLKDHARRHRSGRSSPPAPAASHLLFHCEECHTYVDQKDFVVHMSQHAVQYQPPSPVPDSPTPPLDGGEAAAPPHLEGAEAAAPPSLEGAEAEPPPPPEGTEAAPPPPAVKLPSKRAKKKVMKDENENTEVSAKPTLDGRPPPRLPESDVATDAEPSVLATVDEFSDHSDAEFDPIPESVFEAIEDSRDAAAVPDGAVTVSGEPAPPAKRHRRERSCPVCHKVYTASSSYFYHVKHAHSTVREHTCIECGRAFGSRGLLKQHEVVHSAERPHACTVCGAKFRSRAGLYIHEQSHGGPRSHRCPVCGRAFRWRAALARHQRRHEAAGGGGSHACPECGRAFAVRGDLLRHRRTHAAAVTPALRCPHVDCRAAFAQPRYLRVHLQRRHGGLEPQQAVPGSQQPPPAVPPPQPPSEGL